MTSQATATPTPTETEAKHDAIELVVCPDCDGTGKITRGDQDPASCERCRMAGKIPADQVDETPGDTGPDPPDGPENTEDRRPGPALPEADVPPDPAVMDPARAIELLQEAKSIAAERRGKMDKLHKVEQELKRVTADKKRLEVEIDTDANTMAELLNSSEPLLPFGSPGADDKPADGFDPEAWKTEPVKVLVEHGLAPGLLKKFLAQDISTLGEAQAWLNPPDKQPRGWHDLPGVGRAGRTRIEAAWDSYMAAWAAQRDAAAEPAEDLGYVAPVGVAPTEC